MKNPRIDRDWREPLRRSEVSTDWAITLSRVQWDYFATMTFAGNLPHTKICFGLAFRWLRGVALYHGVPYNHQLIAMRGEVGEQKGRFHFHCLVGGTNSRNYHAGCHWMEHHWKSMTSGARVEVRKYDRSLAGAAYIVKCLDGANKYELDKYSFAQSVTLSDSVISLIRYLDSKGLRHCREQERKNGMVAKTSNGVCMMPAKPLALTMRHPDGEQASALPQGLRPESGTFLATAGLTQSVVSSVEKR